MAFGLAYTNSWHWRERDATTPDSRRLANSKWHRWQYWGVLIPTFMAFSGLTLTPVSIFAIVVSIPVWWIIFDGVAAKRLGKKWWYVGETATIDKLIKSPAPKFILLILSLIFYFLGKFNVI